MSYIGSIILGFILFLALVEALEADVNNNLYWFYVAIIFLICIALPLIMQNQKIIITDKEVQTTILFMTAKIPIEELRQVNFLGFFGIPKPGKNILNIDLRFTNRKQALDFFEGKVDISGAEKVK